MEKKLSLKSGFFTLLSVNVHDVADDLRSAKASYKIEADGAAGKVILSERVKLKPARQKNVLHGYVVRNDVRTFEIIYNLETEELNCVVLKK